MITFILTPAEIEPTRIDLMLLDNGGPLLLHANLASLAATISESFGVTTRDMEEGILSSAQAGREANGGHPGGGSVLGYPCTIKVEEL